MKTKTHKYNIELEWTGNLGKGTANYKAYSRNHSIKIENKIPIQGSADPSFLGDPSLHNPEEMFLASLSSCHMLWYLHLCATAGITVLEYTDKAVGKMIEKQDGSGAFEEVILHPNVRILEQDKISLAQELHHKANQMCFIANSCNFPIKHISLCESKEYDPRN